MRIPEGIPDGIWEFSVPAAFTALASIIASIFATRSTRKRIDRADGGFGDGFGELKESLKEIKDSQKELKEELTKRIDRHSARIDRLYGLVAGIGSFAMDTSAVQENPSKHPQNGTSLHVEQSEQEDFRTSS